MTSSLVGSEMCIRDSQPTQDFIDLEEDPPFDCSEDSVSSYGNRGCGFSPVSYTHLTLPTICSV
eukprot:5701811-Prorocentrum_lima.AAC.1